MKCIEYKEFWDRHGRCFDTISKLINDNGTQSDHHTDIGIHVESLYFVVLNSVSADLENVHCRKRIKQKYMHKRCYF